MAERMISLAPVQPVINNVESDIYTVPAGVEAVISSLVICNVSATLPAKVNVRKAKGGAATNINQSGLRNQLVGPEETMVFSPAYTLAVGDKIRVSSDTGTVVFDVNGSEVGGG